MSRALLDVNVLLALLDSDHVDHGRAQDWARTDMEDGWASCAITENGFVRIISQPRYPSSVSSAEAIALLRQTCADGDQRFWPCRTSLLDDGVIDRRRVHGPRPVTDVYLLALAVEHNGRFVTFDRSIPLSAVRHAADEHVTIL